MNKNNIVSAASHKSHGHTINNSILRSLNIPVGVNVVIYDRLGRRALFYRNIGERYQRVLVRDKRGQLIRYRDDDMVFSMDFDGRITAGDTFGVFISENAALKAGQH